MHRRVTAREEEPTPCAHHSFSSGPYERPLFSHTGERLMFGCVILHPTGVAFACFEQLFVCHGRGVFAVNSVVLLRR